MRPHTEKIILGTVQFGLNYGINNLSGKPSEESVLEILNFAHENGVKTLDTAQAYGNAYDVIGRFHSETGKRFLVNTKFSCGNIGVRQQLEQALKKISINCVNVFFYHKFEDLTTNKEALLELKILKAEKLINKIGLSVYTNQQLSAAIETEEIDCIQMPFNLLDNNCQRGELLKKAKLKSKEVQIRSVFLQGLFFKDINSYPDYMQPLKKYIQEIKNIATTYSKSMEELALSYVFSENLIDYIIIGVDSKNQLVNNIYQSAQLLDNEARKKIDCINVKETELLYPYNWK